jgi:hypothetical protein
MDEDQASVPERSALARIPHRSRSSRHAAAALPRMEPSARGRERCASVPKHHSRAERRCLSTSRYALVRMWPSRGTLSPSFSRANTAAGRPPDGPSPRHALQEPCRGRRALAGSSRQRLDLSATVATGLPLGCDAVAGRAVSSLPRSVGHRGPPPLDLNLDPGRSCPFHRRTSIQVRYKNPHKTPR